MVTLNNNYIKQAEDLLIQSLELVKKKKYNITRFDGWRIAIAKIRDRPPKKQPITKDDIKKVKELQKTGKTYPEIAQILGVTQRRIVRVIKKANGTDIHKPDNTTVNFYAPQIRRLREKGFSYHQIRTKLHISSQIIVEALKKYNMLKERHSKKDNSKRVGK